MQQEDSDAIVPEQFWSDFHFAYPEACKIDWVSGDFIFESDFNWVRGSGEAFSVRLQADSLPGVVAIPLAGSTPDIELIESTKKARRGRPSKWDWEGALAHVVSIAQRPDGLPTGDGAQSKIETLIADWFVSETGNSPATSQIRQRARTIMQLVTKG